MNQTNITHREVTDAQEAEQGEQYETSSDYSQMAPQIDEPTYIYEQQTGTVVAGPAPGAGPAIMPDHLKKDNNSAEREHPVVEPQPGAQTVYVDHSNGEEAEALRYTNVHVRYADETAYHISRYEYHQSQQQHASAHAQQQEDIKNEMERNHHEHAAIHNYEPSPGEVGHRSESQQVCVQCDNVRLAKILY